MVKSLLLLTVICRLPGFVPAAFPQDQPLEDQERQYAARGVEMMMDGDLDGAIEVFRQIQRKDYQSPLGYLLESDATWWKIYYSTANLIDPDVFAATDLPTTPYDAHFDDMVNLTIQKAETLIRAHEDPAHSYLLEGMAYGLRARLEGLRDRDLPTARAGKKMRTLLLKSLDLDPNLTDAYLGIGIYNYFADTLSPIVKFLAIFIRLPRGEGRIEGLRQMELVARKGELARAEAKFYLAKDYSRANERQYSKAIQLFQELAQEHPRNPLWPMLLGSLQFRINRPQQGEAIYREVYRNTAGKRSEVDQALHKASREALQRLNQNEKFE